MTLEELKKYEEKGFLESKFNKLISIQLLLLRAAEHYNQECIEYVARYGLYCMDNKKDLNDLDRHVKKVAGKINPMIKKNQQNILNLMEDFDTFIKDVDKFIGHESV